MSMNSNVQTIKYKFKGVKIMKKNLKKIIIAVAATSVLMACGNNAKTSETKEAVAESVEAGEAGMSIEAGSDMPIDMPYLPGAENGKIKSISDGVIRIERISYVGNEVQSSDSKDEQDVPEEVDLLLDNSGIKFVDISTGLVSDAPKEGDEIYAWVAPEYMMSMPPQVNSYVVLTNVPDKLHMPMYTDSIEGYEEADGKINLKDTLNNAKWSVDNKVKPVLSSTGEEVEFSDIKKGDKVLVWSDNFMLTGESKEAPEINVSRVVILR